MFRIWIDADGCPVTEETIDTAEKHGISVVIVCDTSHELYYEGVETIVVDQGKDHADFAILNDLHRNDIVVTQDYGLASLVLSKNAYAISNNGLQYTKDIIDEMLYQRMVQMNARKHGQFSKHQKKRTKQQNLDFLYTLAQLIIKIQKIEDLE